MQINKIENTNPSFNAKLVARGQNCVWDTQECLKKHCQFTDLQVKVLQQKFEKATKDIRGTLCLDFGEYYENPYMCRTSNISYSNKGYEDSIPCYFDEQVSTNNTFIEKLVKMIEIFDMRKKNNDKVIALQKRIANLSQSTRASSLGATETLFEMPDWRNNKYIK